MSTFIKKVEMVIIITGIYITLLPKKIKEFFRALGTKDYGEKSKQIN